MSTKRICYTRPSGEVSIVIPALEYIAQFETEAAALAAIQAKDVPIGATNVVIIDAVALPATRRFRNTWRQLEAAAPSVNMPLARLQRMDEVRENRRPKLMKSDTDLLKAQEAGDTTLVIRLKDYRQKLRDLPVTEQPNVDVIAMPEALATWEPTWPTDPVP